MILSDFKFWEFFICVLVLVIANAAISRKWLAGAIIRQNIILLVASYYFYAQWDWRLLGLLIFVTLNGYLTGIQIEKSLWAKTWVAMSVMINLAILGFFKYFGFFAEQAIWLLSKAGVTVHALTLKLLLPVGISFYILQSISYVVDVYRGKMSATKDWLAYAVSIAFFPKLVTGPIERSGHFLPQLQKLWQFNRRQMLQGMQLILFGLVLKIVIADHLAVYADKIFAEPGLYNGGVLVMGILYYTFQIYGDFCGYSVIALGAAKILGIELMTNFDTPYFSTSIREFWRRWHISLSTFFRDYVYIPLGGSKEGAGRTYLNLMLTFLLSGFWHGASWTFIVWRGYHGLLLCINQIILDKTKYCAPSRLFKVIAWATTFAAVSFGWLFFRSNNMASALKYADGILARIAIPDQLTSGINFILLALVLDFLWQGNPRLDASSDRIRKWQKHSWFQYSLYTVLLWLVILFYQFTGSNDFIYFKF